MVKETAFEKLASVLATTFNGHTFAADVVRGTKVGAEGKLIMAKALLRLREAAYAVIDSQGGENES